MELGRGQNRETVRANRIRPQGNAYAFSGIQYFTTDSKNTGSEYQCGILPQVNISNKSPLQTALGTNEVFIAGDFPVTVLQSQGTSGTYTGYGYIEVPYLADTKIKVTFSNIQLNTDKQLIGGILETTYDVNESSLSYVSQGIGETFGDRGVESVLVDYTISEIQYVATPPPGRIIITGNSGKGNNDDSGNGESSRQELPAGKDYAITDKEGNVWHVDEEGNVTKGEKVAEGGASNAQNTEGITGSGSNAQVSQYTAKGVNVEWHETTETKYAYDTADKLPELKDKYPTVKDADGNTVYVSYKAVVNRSEDVFGARITFTDEALKDRKIIFKTLKIGQEVVAQKGSDNNYTLTLKGTMNYAEEDVIAVLMPNDSIQKQQVIGSFKLVHLEPKEINVTLVPADEVSKGKLANIRKETNAIYSKVGVTINFNEDEVFDIKPYLDGKEDILTEKNTLLSTYSSVQQAINNAYGERNSDRYVLFVTNKESSTGQMGYMRLSGRFGYIFQSPTSKTVAHEIGHGVFQLEHPWEKYKISESSTDLLMDYSQGTNLFHLDWKQINDPKLKFYVFQGQGEGMISQTETKTVYISQAVSDALKTKGYVYDPTGKAFTLPDGYRISELCYQDNSGKNAAKIGSVIVLFDKDKKRYISYKNDDDAFLFYALEKEKGKENEKEQKISVSYTANKTIPANAIRIIIDSCKIYIDKVAYGLGDTGHPCYTFKSQYAIAFYEKFTGLVAPEVMEQVGIIARYMDNMDQEYLKELIEKANYENSSAADDPMVWDYYFKPLFRSYAKGQEPNAERLKGTYNRVLAYNKACADLARRANASEADKFTTADQIVELVKDISFGGKVVVAETPFSKLTNDQRKYLLQILSEGNMSGRNNIGESYKAEDIVLQIFRTAANNDIAALIKGLDKTTLFRLLSETDDHLYFMQGQFTELVLRLSIALMEQDRIIENYETLFDLLFSKGNYLVFDNGYFGKKNTEVFSEANEKICLKVGKEIWRELLNGISPTGGQIVNSLVQGKDYSNKCYDPLEYIAIIPVRDIDYGYIKLTKGEMTVVPAILGYLIFKSETVANAQTTAIIAANTALCMVGASGLSAAISSGSTLSAVATGLDITLGVGAGIVNTVPEIAQDHPEFTKYYNYATIIYTLNRLGYSKYQSVKAKWPKSAALGGNKTLYSVDKSFQAGDEAVEVYINGRYELNPTATTIDELTINPSGTVKGKKWLQKEQTTEELLNGSEYMYVIDENDRLIIGTRAQHTDFSKPSGKAPHPTLISGADPKVQAAGTIEFRGGKIYKVDNASGHYKPSAESLKKVEEIFRRDFPANSFTNDFKGFIQYGN
ncbi:hypothetical protein FACS1894169_04680 [Bacteroidia bacterium]|nr:hypothetical protein FACS1894169_04680 [Bacteroidia bacterium]